MDASYIVLFYGLHLVLLLFLLFYLISFYRDMDRWSDANKWMKWTNLAVTVVAQVAPFHRILWNRVSIFCVILLTT